MSSKGRETITTTGAGVSISPVKGLVQALSEIQFISEGEKRAGDYNPDMLVTLNVRLSFMSEGIHATFMPLLFSFFSFPFCIAIFKRLIPAFGTYEHSLFDELLILLLSFSPSFLKMCFIAFVISQCYMGKTTTTLIKYFVFYSMIPLVFIFSVIGFFLYNIIYLYFADAAIQKISFGIISNNPQLSYTIYRVLLGIKKSIPLSSLIFIGYGIAECIILTLSYLFALHRTKKIKKVYEYWGLREE